jgi:hypothetical protein
MLHNLPIHPTLRHPLTGAPLQAVYVDKNGRPRYPIMGGAPDDPPAPTPPAPTPPAPTPPAPTPPAPEPDKDLGFPKDTPVAEMKPVEQAAYWRDKARKHEGRNSEWQQALGGKTAAEVKAEIDTLRREKLSDQEKAVEDAKKEARESAASEYAPKAARAVFELALTHVEDTTERSEILEAIDLKSVIKENGDIDTDKVNRIVARLAPTPAGKAGQQRIRDFGAGDRRTDKSSGVAAGRDLFKERRGNKSTTTTDS